MLGHGHHQIKRHELLASPSRKNFRRDRRRSTSDISSTVRDDVPCMHACVLVLAHAKRRARAGLPAGAGLLSLATCLGWANLILTSLIQRYRFGN